MNFDQPGVDAEHLLLGRIAVGDEPTIEPIAAAGDVGDRLGDPAAGAGLGRRQPPAAFSQTLAHARREPGEFMG